MKKICFLFIFFIFCFSNVLVVNAKEDTINVIFSKYNVVKEEEFLITINYNNITEVNSLQLVLELNEYFDVVNDKACFVSGNSYFNEDEIYVNEYLDDIIRFVCFKKSNINSFTNLCCIKLKAKTNIVNLYTYFENIKINLFNKDYELIETKINISEGMDINWQHETYIIELNNKIPNFIDDIKVLNRQDSEYLLNIEHDIDTSKVGNYIVTLYFYDYTNNQTIIKSKSVTVVDLVKPIIKGSNTINLLDVELDLKNLYQFEVSDNYDETLKVNIKYFDQDQKEIKDLEEFYNYLKNNTIGVIKVTAEDSSKNVSDEFVQTIKISDTLAPVIECGDILVLDTKIDDFKLLDYITLVDQYDPNPKLTYLINGKSDEDIIELLKEEYVLNISLVSIDMYNNCSIEHMIKVSLVDTSPPEIIKITDIEIKDVDFTTLDDVISKSYNFVDNFKIPLSFNYTYYLEDTISKDELINALFSNKTGSVKIKSIDSFGNESNIIEVKIKVVDTLAPIITVQNIEENKKYLSISNVTYDVQDNFNNPVEINIYLDGEIYKNNTISQIGQHQLKIEAIDQSGNKSIKTINFEIIKNNLIGCGTDTSCYKDNYIDIIYFAILLFGLSLFIVVISIAVKRNRRRNKEI
ncbi:MAG: hypothetical protein IKC22_05205 [Bacilli bacterium]|nr:hypothetical protein [Bacilli bacterium]